MTESFRALVTSEVDGAYVSTIETKTTDALVDGDILIAVSHSSVNYKDMLSASGNKGVTRHYPHTPGIDAAGVVIESSEPSLPIGTDVAVIGFDLGMNTPGGFAERIRVPASWVLRLPVGLSPREAMQYGTAGLTASLCVEALERAGIEPSQGDVLVTGASGGVGSFAVALLAKRGFRVFAASRKPEAEEFLRSLGAAEIVRPETLSTSGGRPLARERWAAAVDTIGGELLFEIVKSLRYGGAVAACGMASGIDFTGNVYPFILRGARLLGVDSVALPRERKQATLERLAGVDRLADLDRIAAPIPLDALPEAIEAVRDGRVIGRYLVDVGG